MEVGGANRVNYGSVGVVGGSGGDQCAMYIHPWKIFHHFI